jgi:cation:H+ antiporter
MSDRQWKPIGAIIGAFALTAPWASLWLTTGAGTFTGGKGPLGTYWQVTITMSAIIGAAFLLAWGADAAEEDVPQSVAIAGLAVVAVAPEYAIDAYYAWMAGTHPGYGHFAHLAVANFTGANRILIGIGWSIIVLYAIYQARWGGVEDESIELTDDDDDGGYLTDAVSVGSSLSTEYVVLFIATLYGFFVPYLGGLGWLDTVVLVGLYIGYAYVIVKRGRETGGDQVGVAKYIAEQSTWIRRGIVLFLFVYSGAVIVTAVEPFANALEHIGTALGIPTFLVVQWIAPIASESPEIIVTGYLVNKARSTEAMNALVSSKLNQWTLLVGTLVVVYSLGIGHYKTFPLTAQQTGEIWLTAAYGFLALALLVDLRLSVRESIFLLVTLGIQIIPWVHQYWRLVGLSVVYIVIGIGVFVVRRSALREVFGLATEQQEAEETSAVDTVD